MKFRTEYIPSKSRLTLDPSRPVVLIGSCFADNIARKMRECQWNVFNGAGTLYNPISIARVLEMMLFDENWNETVKDSIFEYEGYFHSWLFDSHFSRKSIEDLVEYVGDMRLNLVDTLEKAQSLIVTFGTSWCYFLEGKSDYVVANCHKMPQLMFSRRRVSIGEIVDLWSCLCNRINKAFPNLKVIFTVSPVRHLKDGFEGNARSKATLLVAVEEICDRIDDAIYFPAYEIVTDDLRDYRFYASDLVHPSDQAVEYLWEIFQFSFLDAKGIQTLRDGNKSYRRECHRPIKK